MCVFYFILMKLFSLFKVCMYYIIARVYNIYIKYIYIYILNIYIYIYILNIYIYIKNFAWEVQSKKVFYICHTSTSVLYWAVIEQQSVLY